MKRIGYNFDAMNRIDTEIERHWSYMHVCLPPDRQIGIHSRPSWELSLVITGEGTRSIGGVRSAFKAGDLVLVVPNMKHVWEFRDDVTDAQGNIECITLNWSSQLMMSLQTTMPEWEPVVTALASLGSSMFIPDGKAGPIAGLLCSMDDQDETDRVLTMLKIIRILAQQIEYAESISKTSELSRAEQRMLQIKNFATCNYARHITIDDVAQHISMNRSSFCVFFRQQTGQTFIKYLNNYRIRVAAVSLQCTDLTVSTICYQCGFNDVGYFDRLFKRTFGMTPIAYRLQKPGTVPDGQNIDRHQPGLR